MSTPKHNPHWFKSRLYGNVQVKSYESGTSLMKHKTHAMTLGYTAIVLYVIDLIVEGFHTVKLFSLTLSIVHEETLYMV